MGPQDPKDAARDIARGLTGLVGEQAALRGDAANLLEGPEYEALRQRPEAAVVEARRRLNSEAR